MSEKYDKCYCTNGLSDTEMRAQCAIHLASAVVGRSFLITLNKLGYSLKLNQEETRLALYELMCRRLVAVYAPSRPHSPRIFDLLKISCDDDLEITTTD